MVPSRAHPEGAPAGCGDRAGRGARRGVGSACPRLPCRRPPPPDAPRPAPASAPPSPRSVMEQRRPAPPAAAWDLRTLYVDNTEGDSLTPIDPRTAKPASPIPVTDPYNLYFAPDGSRAIVVAERFDRLDFRDPHSWQLIKSVPAPAYRQPCPDVGATDINGLDHLDFSADGRFFLLSSECSGRMFKVDVATMSFAGEVDVGGSPVDVKLSPDGKVFYVANQKRNGVSVIDADALREIAFIPTGEGAHGLYPSR